MPTKPYMVKDVRVPGVTTILGDCNNCGGLMYWAHQEGVAGRDFRDTSKKACDIGTVAHEMIECFLTKTPFIPELYPTDIVEPAKLAFGAFQEWYGDGRRYTIVGAEVSLISNKFYYGGTIDLVEFDGKLVVRDWKTSKKIMPSYYVQVAAYRNLLCEVYPNQKVANYADVCRFDKVTGDFAHHRISCLDDHWREFLHTRAIYELRKSREKRIPNLIETIEHALASSL